MKSLQTISSGALRMARTAFSRQGLILLSLAFGALLVVPGVNPPTARAATCPGGAVCLYQNINFGGGEFRAYPSAIGQCINVTSYNNQASSWRADTVVGSWMLFFDDANCNMGGQYIGGSAHGSDDWVGSTFNDKISSFKIYN